LVLELKVLFIYQKQFRKSQQISKQREDQNNWAEQNSKHSVDYMLTFVILSLIVNINVYGISDLLHIEHRYNWEGNKEAYDAIHQNHNSVLYL
jgi:hypothetical protein